MNNVKEALLFLTIILIPFQDTGLQGLPIGFLGGALSFIPLALLLMIAFFEWLTGGRLEINRGLVFIIIYIVLVTVLYLILFGTRSHGTNLIFKSFNLSILSGLLVLPVFFLNFDSDRIGRYIHLAFLIALAGVVLADILQLDFLANDQLLHFHENRNMRPRGFSLESSTLAVTIITLGLVAAEFARRWPAKIFILLATVLTVLYSESRGGLILLILAAIFMIFSGRAIRLRAKVGLTLLVVLLGYLAMIRLESSFIDDIEMYTSTSTRLGLAAAALVTLIYNPLGVGFSGFLPAIDRYVPAATDYLNRLVPGTFNFNELLSYVGADSDINISTKTFLFDHIFFFGLPFLILFILFHKRLLAAIRNAETPFIYGAVVFSLLALSTVTGGAGLYGFTLVYGIALNVMRREKNIDSHA